MSRTGYRVRLEENLVTSRSPKRTKGGNHLSVNRKNSNSRRSRKRPLGGGEKTPSQGKRWVRLCMGWYEKVPSCLRCGAPKEWQINRKKNTEDWDPSNPKENQHTLDEKTRAANPSAEKKDCRRWNSLRRDKEGYKRKGRGKGG